MKTDPPEPMTIERYAEALAALLSQREAAVADVLGLLHLSAEECRISEAHWTIELASAYEKRKGVLAMKFAAAFARARIPRGLIDPMASEPAVEEVARGRAVPSYMLEQAPQPAQSVVPKPAAPLPPPERVEAASVLSTGTLGAMDVPAGPAITFASAEPDSSGFSVTRYARLCAELVKWDDREATRARYGLDAAAHEALDKHWRAKQRADSTIAAAFQRSYAEQLKQLGKSATGDPAGNAKPTSTSNAVDPSEFETTMAANSSPQAADPLPFKAPVPSVARAKLSLVEHASLSAEIALNIDSLEATLAKYGVTADEKAVADETFRQQVRADRKVQEEWLAAFEAKRAELLAPGRRR
jgi:hypothetical protein